MGPGYLSLVQAAQREVALLNSRPLSPPTKEDERLWRIRPYVGGGGVDAGMHEAIIAWRLMVARAERNSRINGTEICDGVIPGRSPRKEIGSH